MSVPETVYAKTSGGWVGYQVAGSGPQDVLVTKPVFFPIEDLMWDEPRLVRFLNGLSSFTRHIWFDPRGIGSSDPIAPVESRLVESFVDDMIAVLDELGCERVDVLDAVGASGAALQFVATHPERTSALVLINPTARFRRADDYHHGFAAEDVETCFAALTGADCRICRNDARASFWRIDTPARARGLPGHRGPPRLASPISKRRRTAAAVVIL